MYFSKMINEELNDEYWSSLYLNQETRWDIGNSSTPLSSYFSYIKDKECNILVPGAGNAYEANELLEKGFTNVTIVDISSVLVNRLKEKFAHKPVNVIHGDFFEHNGQYDLIIEQTFFCALLPVLRKSYAEKMHELLKPGGRLVGLLFNREFEGGPPFGGNEEEYRNLFSPLFDIKKMEPCYNSILPRQGTELFFMLEKK